MRKYAILYLGTRIGDVDAFDTIDAIDQAYSLITVEEE